MKNRISLILVILFAFSLNSFSQSFDKILKAIEQNNKDLQAGSKYVESKSYEYKLNNLPEGPEISYGYFPDNSSTPGTKEIFEVSQSFQMPCFYRNQSAYSKLMIGQEELKYLVLRQNILREAKDLLIEYIYLIKQISINDKRLKFAEDIYNAYLIRNEVGDINALELNKTKLHLLQVRKQEGNLKLEILAVKENLKNLNGGIELNIEVSDYPLESILELDSVLFSRMEYDPEIMYNQKVLEASDKNIKVIQNLQLPEFNFGYGSETVSDEKFKGFLVGVTIPLWNSKRAIQQVKAESDFYSLNYSAITQSKLTETNVQYKKVQSLKGNLESYEMVLGSMNNEELLSKSLELGEISVIEFFTEMFYVYEVYDDYLAVEKDYHQALSDLYKFRL
ncbi:TolC family protein [Bacteroidota bacterium]